MSATTKGYNFELSGQEIKEFQCTLCKFLLREATELPCSHLNCQSCLWEWQTKQAAKVEGSEGSFHCPSCNAPYTQDKLHKSDVTDRIITSSLDIKCPLHVDGCTWRGKIPEYQNLHKKVCEFTADVKCLNEGCNKMLRRNQVKSHMAVCTHNPPEPVECSGCWEEFPPYADHVCVYDYNTIQERKKITPTDNPRHYEVEVKCPAVMCKKKIKLSDLKSHVFKCNTCDFTKVMYEKKLQSLSTEQEKAEKILNRARVDHERIEEEMKDYTNSIKDFKRKFRFIESKLNKSDEPQPNELKPDKEEEKPDVVTKLISMLSTGKKVDHGKADVINSLNDFTDSEDRMTLERLPVNPTTGVPYLQHFVDLMDKENVRLFYKLVASHPSCVHLEDTNQNTLLHHAVKKLNKLAIVVLLEHESNPWKENKDSQNSLHMYEHITKLSRDEQRENCLELLKIISFYDGTFVNTVGAKLQWSVLNDAAFWNEIPMATFLLNQPGIVVKLEKDSYKLKEEIKKLLKTKKKLTTEHSDGIFGKLGIHI